MHRDLVPEAVRDMLFRTATDLLYCTGRLDREGHRRPGDRPTYRKTLTDAERAALAPLREAGFTVVGTGIARCVLRFPPDSPRSDHVVKLARFGLGPVSHGAVQNRREAMLWARHGAGDWPLVPVADLARERFAWLAMPYGDPVAELPDDERARHVEAVRRRIRFLPAFDMRELSASNLVVRDGTPLVADYGLPEGQ